ncbi:MULTISPECIES: hypothetical protein [unclassified Streptomyces]|uniref:hypothetical protein n=1 Tax=unclassified Streptomyces TaxID=2593676 RepID=UPI0022B670EA|nr:MULTISPECIES: hypothetical protein [unclassified Streptomyces]MCZ7414874.1 hypothetical protein [Streptomyces sp. WMMC897]MCZ7431817.1 hypothetical protein [Streptomyces sp. WMMC1477]
MRALWAMATSAARSSWVWKTEVKGASARSGRRGVPPTPRRRSAPVELAIRDWARRDESVAERLRRVDNRRMDYLRSLFDAICGDADEAEVRSLITFSLRIGTSFVAAEHRGRSREEVMRLARRHLLR